MQHLPRKKSQIADGISHKAKKGTNITCVHYCFYYSLANNHLVAVKSILQNTCLLAFALTLLLRERKEKTRFSGGTSHTILPRAYCDAFF